jgi:ATP-dependent helicase/DNAse subunit B
MHQSETSKNHVALSASRSKTAQSCSFRYWASYHLKLPDKKNDGSSKGSVCHIILEMLGNPRHKKHYDKIIRERHLFASKAVEKLTKKHAKLLSVDDEDNLQQICKMTLAGLQYDFFGTELGEPTESLSEYAFDIEVNEGGYSYKIKGFIDKLFLYKDQGLAVIRDFKSSKEIFKGKDLENNLQDLMYSLAVKKLFPEYKDRRSEFLFLKFLPEEKGVVRMPSLSEEELDGFQAELTEIQKYLDNFNFQTAMSNLAAHQDYPKDNSFSGPLQCGRATKKGELKKDGSIKWHCPYKFGFFYYKICDLKGKMITSCYAEDFDEYIKKYPEDKFLYQMMEYQGCPAHQKRY